MFIIAVGARMTNIHYASAMANVPEYDYYSFRIGGLTGKTLIFFEPCVDVKVRLKGARCIAPHIQLGVSSDVRDYDTRKFNFSIGISVLSPEKKKQK